MGDLPDLPPEVKEFGYGILCSKEQGVGAEMASIIVLSVGLPHCWLTWTCAILLVYDVNRVVGEGNPRDMGQYV